LIPLYILGLLLRFGPQHGYRIKKLIGEQMADFTQIKLPTIYYHLVKMEAKGWLIASPGKKDARPEKTTYRIAPAGKEAFSSMLKEALLAEYRPTFPVDGAFYFSEHLNGADISASLRSSAQKLKEAVAAIRAHRDETMAHIPKEHTTMAAIIFAHHEKHYIAELAWVEETLEKLEGVNKNDKATRD
jgi:DNA-binding PadR family transcriptional regulator